jgi:hypothetical protein
MQPLVTGSAQTNYPAPSCSTRTYSPSAPTLSLSNAAAGGIHLPQRGARKTGTPARSTPEDGARQNDSAASEELMAQKARWSSAWGACQEARDRHAVARFSRLNNNEDGRQARRT